MPALLGDTADTPTRGVADRVVHLAGVLLGASLIVLTLSGVPLVWRYRPTVGSVSWDRGIHRVSATTALWAALIWGLASAARAVGRRRGSAAAGRNVVA